MKLYKLFISKDGPNFLMKNGFSITFLAIASVPFLFVCGVFSLWDWGMNPIFRGWLVGLIYLFWILSLWSFKRYRPVAVWRGVSKQLEFYNDTFYKAPKAIFLQSDIDRIEVCEDSKQRGTSPSGFAFAIKVIRTKKQDVEKEIIFLNFPLEADANQAAGLLSEWTQKNAIDIQGNSLNHIYDLDSVVAG